MASASWTALAACAIEDASVSLKPRIERPMPSTPDAKPDVSRPTRTSRSSASIGVTLALRADPGLNEHLLKRHLGPRQADLQSFHRAAQRLAGRVQPRRTREQFVGALAQLLRASH